MVVERKDAEHQNAPFRARSWCSRGWGRDGDVAPPVMVVDAVA